MFPETEAQKVIAISLGKIAISRSQRGGPKLFKNLLVANVIQKARNIVWDETAFQCRTRYAQPNCEASTEQWEQVPYSGNSNGDASTQHVSLNAGSDDSASDEFHRPTASRDSDSEAAGIHVLSGMDIAENCECWDEQNKENVLPVQENTASERTNTICTRSVFAGEKLYFSSSVSLPSRCVKRRNSTSEEMCTLHSSKKARKDLKEPRQTWRRSESYLNLDSDSEISSHETSRDVIDAGDDQMDLEQITSLVSVFSSSFKGLVDNPSQNTTGGEITGFYSEKTTSLRRGASLQDVASVCSKQAGSLFTMRQSSFENSTPPIVALTV